MRRFLKCTLVFLLIFSIIGCSSQQSSNSTSGQNGEESSGKKFTMKVATFHADNHPQVQSLNKFKELVEKQTAGNVKVEIYPNSQLGSEDAYIPSVKNGTVEMGVAGTMIANEGAPLIAVTEMPFLFKDWEHAKGALTGPIGEEMSKGLLENAGVRNLGWTVNGFRQVSSSKPIEEMGDFKGMRLRVPNVPNYVEMAKALGANPVTMSFNELFTALEQKVVDGQENPYPTDVASRFYEVQKYILETKHMFAPNLWVINEGFFQKLPKEYQDAVTSAAKEAVEYNWKVSEEEDQKSKQTLLENEVEIIVPDEKFQKQLIESQKEVEKWYYKEYEGSKEIVEKIRANK